MNVSAPDSDRQPPAAPTGLLAWRCHAASATGFAHIKGGLPNQDAVGSRLAADSGGAQVLITAVADGHGDARHFRSDRGARLAVAHALAAAADWAASMPADPDGAAAAASGALIPDIVARWNAAVAEDIGADPDEGDVGIGPRRKPLSPIAYGATLLACVIAADLAVLVQIGDGDIVAVQPGGGFTSPVPDDPTLDGRRTTSICQPDAASAFRVGVVDLAATPLFAVLAATDGFGNSQAAEDWQNSVAADLVLLAESHGLDWLAAAVPAWAQQCASSAGSGDDCSVALAVNSDVRLTVPDAPEDGNVAAPGPAITEPPATGAGTPSLGLAALVRRAGAAASRVLRSRPLVAGLVAVLVLTVIAGALLVSRQAGGHHRGRVPSPAPSVSPTQGRRPIDLNRVMR